MQLDVRPGPGGGCILAFCHAGLVADLACYDDCRAGWDHFLASLASFCERGIGTPFRA